jgi:hypothetical protein
MKVTYNLIYTDKVTGEIVRGRKLKMSGRVRLTNGLSFEGGDIEKYYRYLGVGKAAKRINRPRYVTNINGFKVRV